MKRGGDQQFLTESLSRFYLNKNQDFLNWNFPVQDG